MRNRPLTVLVALVSAAAPALAQRHPHFDDGGALAWHKTFAAAKAAANTADKLIFVEYGREA